VSGFDLSNVWGTSDDVSFGRKKPGSYLAEVGKAEFKTSQAGHPRVALTLVDVEDGKQLCFDNLNLVGKPTALAMTKSKLKALGYTASSLEPTSLVGLRVRVWLKLGDANDKGKRYLEVDAFDCPDDFRFGYKSAQNEKPAPASAPKPASSDPLSDVFGNVPF